MALRIVLLQGPRRGLFLVSEVPVEYVAGNKAPSLRQRSSIIQVVSHAPEVPPPRDRDHAKS